MVTNIATEQQMFSADQQEENIRLVREFIGGHQDNDPGKYDRYLAENARVFLEARADYPIEEKTGIGLDVLKENAKQLSNIGFTYDIEIHSIYACGPVVVVSRTDTRKEDGKPDKPVPAVGVFAVHNGKIIEWSDYYR